MRRHSRRRRCALLAARTHGRPRRVKNGHEARLQEEQIPLEAEPRLADEEEGVVEQVEQCKEAAMLAEAAHDEHADRGTREGKALDGDVDVFMRQEQQERRQRGEGRAVAYALPVGTGGEQTVVAQQAWVLQPKTDKRADVDGTERGEKGRPGRHYFLDSSRDCM